ncbi:MAG: porin [Planctomycetota bacterium]
MNRKMSVSIVAGTAFGLAGAAFGQANDSRVYSAELLADAEERSSLLQAGTSGYDDEFFIQSSDGNFRLGIDGFTQFRYRINFQDDSAPAGAAAPDSVELGFGIARTRLAFQGFAGSPEVRYRIEGSFGEENSPVGPAGGGGLAGAGTGGVGGAFNGNFGLLDAFIEYDWSDSITLRAGQFRAPFLLERLIAPTQQQTIERSNQSRAFDLGFVQGVQAEYNTGAGWRARVAFHDGGNSVNSTSLSGPIGPAGAGAAGANGVPSTTALSDFAVTGRFDYALSGSLEQFDRYDSGANGDSGLLLGGAAHIQFGDDGVNGPSQDAFLFTVDATYQSAGGWNIAGAFNFRQIEGAALGPGGVSVDTSDVGFLIQGGYYVSEDIEVFGRFDTVVGDAAGDFTTITGGANFYPLADSRALRVTSEIQIFADGVVDGNGVPATTGGASALYGVGTSGTESSVGIGSQVQLTF